MEEGLEGREIVHEGAAWLAQKVGSCTVGRHSAVGGIWMEDREISEIALGGSRILVDCNHFLAHYNQT